MVKLTDTIQLHPFRFNELRDGIHIAIHVAGGDTMTDTNFLDFNPQRIAQLKQMKLIATSLLVLMAVVYTVSAYFEPQAAWVGYINATAEAAMIGAIADWFAVTALFRHPLNLPIPHTAIIPARKDDIASQFGEFVQSNFLSDEVITQKIRSMDLSRNVAGWITKQENADAVAGQITAGLAGITAVLDDDGIQAMIETNVEDKIRSTSFAPIIGDLLSFITSGRRQQELIDGTARMALYMLEENDDDIRDRVTEETPWWFPGSVDKAIYHRIVRSVSKMLYDMQVDIYHPTRVRLISSLNEFLRELQESDDIREKEIAIKEELLRAPAVRQFTGSLWRDLKEVLERQSTQPESELKTAIVGTVTSFGEAILEDPELAGKIDRWAQESARYLIDRYGHEVAALIRETIDNWDTRATSNKIEEYIGKDLQFIRINGTVVGGLAGLAIHSVRQLF